MLGDIIERAAGLAEAGEPTVERALAEYERSEEPIASRTRQIWVSVAFLLKRHAKIALTLPE